VFNVLCPLGKLPTKRLINYTILPPPGPSISMFSVDGDKENSAAEPEKEGSMRGGGEKIDRS